MLLLLRLIGTTNAAVWLGAVVAHICVSVPAFVSGPMVRLLPLVHAGAAELILSARFYQMEYWCAGIALAHVLAEWLYTGKPLNRWSGYVLGAIAGIALLSGAVLLPKAQHLHLEANGNRSTPPQRQRAVGAFKTWEVMIHSANVLTLIGLTVHFWNITSIGAGARFSCPAKFRGLTKSGS